MEDIFDEIERELKRDPHLDEMVDALKENHWQDTVILHTQRQQQLLHEFLVNGKTYNEIAAEQGITASRVREVTNTAKIWMEHYLNRKKLEPIVEVEYEKQIPLNIGYDIKEVMLNPDEDDEEIIKWNLALPIEDIDFSVRAFNCLKGNKIECLNDLLSKHRPGDLLKMRNVGKGTLVEINSVLTHYRLKWRNLGETAKEKVFDYHLYLENLHYTVIPITYPLINFTWSVEILSAFKQHNCVTIKHVMASYHLLKQTLADNDFDFIKTRMNQWGLIWQ